jgi:hypothetical protein
MRGRCRPAFVLLGWFSLSRLHNLIQDGLMRTVNVPLYFDKGRGRISGQI